ncbi:MAG: Cna protein B-type domain protein, partial [Bryobacterales bacterium]|nr:Cna protein B-type domain protein [Bryobacterales bacterium]
RSRNIFYNPGFQNWNGGLFKDFHVTEKQYLTFRAEAFNFLNHPNWSGADTNPNSKYFGQVTNKDSNQPNRNLQLSLRYTF